MSRSTRVLPDVRISSMIDTLTPRRLAFVILLAALGCGGDSGTNPPPPAVATTLVALDGAHAGTVGTTLSGAMRVKLTDNHGDAMRGVTVHWSPGSGTVPAPTSVTNTDGIAGVRWTLGTVAGVQHLTASVESAAGVAPVIFDATAAAGPSTGVIVHGPTATLAPLETAAFTAEVAPDQYGNPVTLPVAWSTSDGYSTPVTADGHVTAGRAGRSTITATVGTVSATASVRVAAIWQAIGAGRVQSCALDKLGYAFCWGENGLSQLGVAGIAYDSIPVAVSGGRRFVSLTVGADHACGLTADHAAWCWGNNSSAQLGIGTIADPVATPTAVAGGHAFTALSTSNVHTCGITTANEAYCWGWEGEGELGNGASGSFSGRPTPQLVLGGLHYASLSAGSSHTCAITLDGDSYCWGNDYEGQVGDGNASAGYRTTPTAVTGSHALARISAGGAHSCGTDVAGATWCWGSNTRGQVGDGSTQTTSVPVAVQASAPLTQISAGYFHSCALSADNRAFCWGFNENGQLGDGTTARQTAPVAVSTALHFTTVSAGWEHTCGLTADGKAYCWGDSHIGQLGAGIFGFRTTPVAVLDP